MVNRAKSRVNIRLGKMADVEALKILCTQLGYSVELSDLAQRLTILLQSETDQIYVAVMDDQVVGWVHALQVNYLEAGPFVEIGGLVVDQKCRGEGIGRKLMAAAEKWATQQGISLIRLRSNAIRLEAHQFYHQLGYLQEKTQYVFTKKLVGPYGD